MKLQICFLFFVFFFSSFTGAAENNLYVEVSITLTGGFCTNTVECEKELQKCFLNEIHTYLLKYESSAYSCRRGDKYRTYKIDLDFSCETTDEAEETIEYVRQLIEVAHYFANTKMQIYLNNYGDKTLMQQNIYYDGINND